MAKDQLYMVAWGIVLDSGTGVGVVGSNEKAILEDDKAV
jgi:hypothetical protein